ncbi:MAG: DUF6492 family protein [Pseudomonadota bacterium]
MRASPKQNAIVTASYSGDFERCKMLCESIDRHATGYTKHYILVDDHDEEMFSALAAENREIVADRELLPSWLHRFPGRIAPKGRPFWFSRRTTILHGWHVQQLRRIAIALHRNEDAFFYCDSDTIFTKHFDLNTLWRGEALRLFREDDGADVAKSDHVIWLSHAADIFQKQEILRSRHNYVQTFIAWRADTVRQMCEHLERVNQCHWISAVARSRKFSECMLYGAYCDAFDEPDKHWRDHRSLCRVQWFNPPPSKGELRAFAEKLENYQVGFGIQSFVNVSPNWIREIALHEEPAKV